MRIVSVEAIPIKVPRKTFRTAISSIEMESMVEYGVVKIETDEGIEGIGEISIMWNRTGLSQCDDVNRYFRPILIGRNPFDIGAIIKDMNRERWINGSEPAKAAVDIALYDIVGKALNTPVYNLLGGKVREKIRLSHSIGMGTSEEVAERALKFVAEGYRTVKMKVGLNEKEDFEALRAIRSVLPEGINLRVDVNMAWRTAKDAVRIIKRFEQFDIEMIEQPVDADDLEGMAFICDHVDVPILADESVWTPEDAIKVVKMRAADVVNVYVSEAGGLFQASRIFAICESARIPCLIGSMPEFGIGTAAQAHLGAAMTNLMYDSDVCGAVYMEDDLLEEPLEIANGFTKVPEKPGLGIKLDEDALAKYRITQVYT